MSKKLLAAAVVVAISGSVNAGDYFTPLTEPNLNSDTSSYNNNPFALPGNYSQEFVASRSSLETEMGGAFPDTFGNWDMLDFGGDNAQYIYIPHEVGDGAGVTRLNRDVAGLEPTILLEGIPGSDFDLDPTDGWDHTNDNFGGLDPAFITPAGTLLTAEEWAGGGRIFELMNPETATSPADANWRWLSSIPSVSHEGIQFDKNDNLYFVDENSSGSIYKFVPKMGNDLSVGQTFVLVVGAGGVEGATGAATWIAMTDENGTALTTTNPFDYTSRGGRAAADELKGTGYCRPEDMSINTLASGNEALYVPATCANVVYSVELIDDTNAMVREFVNSSVTPDNIGNNPVGSGNPSDSTYGLDDPDNAAADAAGNIFLIEDENPGDIFMATDADKDGVAESVSLFASLGKYGSEPTGFRVDPLDPFTWYVNIQHPSGQGNNDSLWIIKHDVTETCNCQTAKNHGNYVSCVAKASKVLGIKGMIKDNLMEVAANASCGK